MVAEPVDRKRVKTIDNLHPGLRRFWHPVAYSRQVSPGPLRVTLLGADYVLVRLADGITALPDRCAHRLAPLSAGSIVEGGLQCAYHGYRYDAGGRCVRIPSQEPETPIPPRAHLQPVRVTERYDVIWIAPDEPVADICPCYEWDDPAFVAVGISEPQVWNAGAAQIIDNLVDYGHFAYRHASTFGTEDEIDISAEPEVHRDGWRITGSHYQMVKDPEDPAGPEHAKPQPREMHFLFMPPFTLMTRIVYPNTGLVTALMALVQPETATTTRVYGYMVRNDLVAQGITETQILPSFEDKIAYEDQWMLEQFPSKSVPVDVGAEVHTKADKMMVEFRRIWSDIIDFEDAVDE